MICLLHMEHMNAGVIVDDLLVVFCLLGVRDSVRHLRKREASLPSTVETPTFGRPEAWPGAAMWQQRDPTLDLDGLDHLHLINMNITKPLTSPLIISSYQQ